MVRATKADKQQVDLLQQAFRTFDQAAATLQDSYRSLTTRLERMDLELAASHEALQLNLNEKEEMRSHLAAVLESLATGVIVADEGGSVVRCNRAAASFLNRAQSDIIGLDLATLLGALRLDLECYPIVAPSGALLSITRTPLRRDTEGERGTIILLHDITRLRQLEERLQRRDRLAAMGEMVGRLAHEIRNPLGSIELFASMLKRDLSDQPERRTYAEHIGSSVRALDRLLSNLLAYTRRYQLSAAWHETETLILDALALAAHAIARVPIEIPLCLDARVPKLWCDANQMKQVLLNLILNAIQAMPNGGTLTISVSGDRDPRSGDPTASRVPDAPTVRLSVTDTGPGIDPALRSRVFDPFYTTKEEGSGLGLAIVHTIVEAHQGRIEIEGDPGQGATVIIAIPAGPPGQDSESDPTGEDSRASRYVTSKLCR